MLLPKFFKPYVNEWFSKHFKELTPPQRFGLEVVHNNKNTIITAPTGSGKTLAAFLSILNKLFDINEKNCLEEKIYCIYISPLRALNNDIYKNLITPLKEIMSIAQHKYKKKLKEIRVALRTGDVTSYEKQKQLKNPPHILITTPETLAIILNAPKFIEHLKGVRWIIVDEIHELANNKRGVHLSLSLERLQNIVKRRIVRIGLGATLQPLKEVAKFLVGYNSNSKLRNCKIIDASWYKKYDLKLITPVRNVVKSSAEKINQMLYHTLDDFISSHTTSLIFTNTRGGTERVVFHLKQKWKNKYEDLLGAHHGSLSRQERWGIEERLKKGELKAVVCSTSLELGIDVGYIDLVVQIGSPKSITRCIQRIGRSGHGIYDVAKGRIIALDRDDIVECCVMLKCAKQRLLDCITIPKNCLDVLAQHIVGMALYKKWNVDDAFKLIRKSYCYKTLSKKEFIKLLKYLAGHYVALEDRNVYAKIWFDEDEQQFGRRGKYTRIIYALNIGTIPDEVKVDVYDYYTHKYIGSIEEEFLERLKRNDIFVLGGKMYKFLFSRGMRCFVKDAKKEKATIPAWFSEMLPLSFDLALEIQKFRSIMKRILKKKEDVIAYLLQHYPIDKNSANSIYEYFVQQHKYLEIPDNKMILIECTKDLEHRNYIVFHALFGRRVNDALSRVLGIMLSNILKEDVGIMVSDNGFAIITKRCVSEKVILQAIKKACNVKIEELLKDNLKRTELLKRRFRHCASRCYLVLRNYKGYKISVARQQVNAQRLLNICNKLDKTFPVIKETYREILYDVMDLDKAKWVLSCIKTDKIKIKIAKTSLASPFAQNLIILSDPDVVLMKDRKKRLLDMYKEIMKRIKD